MIITDHLPKWPINKVEAKQIIYLYGSVNIKFRIKGLKRIRGLGRQVMNGRTRRPWKYGPFNKFTKSSSLSSSLHLPLHSFCPLFHEVSFFPKVCLLSANLNLKHHFPTKKWLQTLQLYERKYLICSIVLSVASRLHVYARSANHTRHWNDETSLSGVGVNLCQYIFTMPFSS